jgi:ABC-2 type transport system ATP-binding protein
MPAEERTLFLRHTSRENLRFHGRLQGIEEAKLKRRIDEVLDVVGLSEARDRSGFALSSGMRARLMLARAILHEPRVLILDEPTGAIDPIGAHDFLELIIKITVERETATLISSHRLEEIDALRDNVLLLDRGRVVFWGNLDHVKEVAKQKTYEVVCVDPNAAQQVAETLRLRLRSSALVANDGSLVVFPASDGSVDLAWLADLRTQVVSVSLRKLSLRETISALLTESSGE